MDIIENKIVPIVLLTACVLGMIFDVVGSKEHKAITILLLIFIIGIWVAIVCGVFFGNLGE